MIQILTVIAVMVMTLVSASLRAQAAACVTAQQPIYFSGAANLTGKVQVRPLGSMILRQPGPLSTGPSG